MKILSSILISFFLISCNTETENPYDESNYLLIKTDSFRGTIGTKYYVHKSDTSRKLKIDYYDNAKLLAKVFTHHGKRDGRFEIYSYEGNLLQVDSFKDGQKIYSHSFVARDTSIRIFKNGKLSPVDTSKEILHQIEN